MVELILVHSGSVKESPILDSLFQVLLLNNDQLHIHVIINSDQISIFKSMLENTVWETFKVDLSVVRMHSIESYNNSINMHKLTESISKYNLQNFRNGFWIHTLSRFFIIEQFIIKNKLENAFHIENDVIMYTSFDKIYKNFNTDGNPDSVWVVKDSETRVIPSIVFFPNCKSVSDLVNYMCNCITQSEKFVNDMELLGKYENVKLLPNNPFVSNSKIVFDGAAIGQYIGGIDCRNIGNGNDFFSKLDCYYKTRGFINETSNFNPGTLSYYRKRVVTDIDRIPLNILMGKGSGRKGISIANVHVHSKMMAKFSSIFDLEYSDVISGDRILNLVDFIFLTRDIFNFHKNIKEHYDKVILVNDFNNINYDKINECLLEFAKKHDVSHIKLFVYTHILEQFQEKILDKLCNYLTFTIYTHNSDHVFDSRYNRILESRIVKHVYAQNLNIVSDKATLLPIGIANSMWKHGDISMLYKTMCSRYLCKKTHGMYVNINPNTFAYRKVILDGINTNSDDFRISKNLPYEEYLNELSDHRFCLCIRGNGIDTHRFWEALYLGVIPVVINNKETNCDAFIKNLRYLDVPFYEIKDDNVDDIMMYDESFFTQDLYNSLIQKSNSSIYNLDSLKFTTFSDFSYL